MKLKKTTKNKNKLQYIYILLVNRNISINKVIHSFHIAADLSNL
jgi:hypothetical protein